MPKKVLVVDDEPCIRAVISAVLRDEGYDVLTADGGQRALELMPSEHPDLVILDVMMPGVDGRDVLRHMGSDSRTAGIPVILMSAAGQGMKMPDGSSPAIAFLAKPFDMDNVLGLVSGLLG